MNIVSAEPAFRRHPLALALLLGLLAAAMPRAVQSQDATSQQNDAARAVERGAPPQSPPPVNEQAADAIDHARDGLPPPQQQGEDPMTSRKPPVQSQGTTTTPEPAPGMLMWTQLDKDRDGRISSTEARADADFSTRFASMDADSDGFVSEVEYRARDLSMDRDKP